MIWYATSSRSSGTKVNPFKRRLNGGPGCSSFDGALVELGPLRITPEGEVRVVENTAWNEYANVLFRTSFSPDFFPFTADRPSCSR